jgi:type IV pilus assembly protein PilN
MIKINLLAEAKPTKRRRGVAALGGAGRLNVVLLVAATLVGLLVCVVQWVLLNNQTKEMDEKIRIAQAEVTRLESVLAEVKDFEEKKEKLQKKVDLINQLKLNQRGPVRLMDEVSKALPDLLWLDRMECRGNGISLTGKAINPPAIANFLENLKRQPQFQEPTVRDITACGGTGAQPLYCFNLGFVFSNLEKVQVEQAAPQPSPTPVPKADAGSTSPSTRTAELPAPAAPVRAGAGS